MSQKKFLANYKYFFFFIAVVYGFLRETIAKDYFKVVVRNFAYITFSPTLFREPPVVHIILSINNHTGDIQEDARHKKSVFIQKN